MDKEFNNLSNLFSYLRSKEVNENILVALRYALSKYFKEKTVVNGKMLTQIFDNIGFAKAFMNLKYDKLSRVEVSKNYAMLWFDFKTRSYYRPDIVRHFYIIGVNSETGKLWIEKVVAGTFSYKEFLTLRINDKELEIEVTDDSNMQLEVLEYTYDLDLDGIENFRLERNSVVRVQGDILMNIVSVGDSALLAYFDALERQVAGRLRRILENRIVRKIVDILESYGLNVRFQGSTIMVPCIRANETEKGIVKRVVTIGRLVHDKLDLKEEFKELNLHDVERMFYVGEERYYSYKRYFAKIKYEWAGHDIVDIAFAYSVNRAFGVESYDSVEISVLVYEVCCFNKAKHIFKKLREQGVLDYVDSKIRVGRHLIKATTKPLALNFELELFGEKHFINVNNLPIVVYDKLELIHPEHLKKTLTIPVPIRVMFSTIRENESFHERVNKYIMDYLVEKYGKDFEFEDEDEEESEI